MLRFEYFNPSDESGSCVPRSLTKLSGKPYAQVKSELQELACRLNKETYNDEEVFGEFLKSIGFEIQNCDKNKTLKELTFDSGEYCLMVSNRKDFYHLLPIKNNIIYDRNNNSLDLYVELIYKK